MQDVPGALRNAFIRGRALQLIQSPTLQRYSVEVMNERAGQPVYQPPRVDPHLFTLLDPDGLEDLLGIYLQHKEGWIIYPSTSKINSPKYEYILFNPRTRRHGAVQVKQSTTQPLLVDDYLDFDGDVFLFQSANLYSSTPDKDHVHLIDPGMLERFCFDNLWLMPPSIRKWVDWKIARR